MKTMFVTNTCDATEEPLELPVMNFGAEPPRREPTHPENRYGGSEEPLELPTINWGEK